MIAILLAATAANPSGITYLTCFYKRGEMVTINVAVDEPNQRVTAQLKGSSLIAEGLSFFSADSIILRSAASAPATTYTINRVDLTFTRSFDDGKNVLVDYGSCEIQKAVPRAF